MKFNGIRAIIWDWNGTLLNDVDACLSAINVLLQKRCQPKLTRQRYRQIFGFPVKNYYRKLGFNIEEEWEEIAAEFMGAYVTALNGQGLFDDVEAILTYLQSQGYIQCILSALENSLLQRHVAHFNLDCYFAQIKGTDDHYAKTKLDKGAELVRKLGLDPQSILCIGDTTHDIEVAQKLNCRCIVVSRGHQNHTRLLNQAVPVLHCLGELTSYL